MAAVAPYLPGAVHPSHHEWLSWTAASGSNAPRVGVNSPAWISGDNGEWGPSSPVPAEIAGFFVEAASRLPIAEIPYLAHCISQWGLAVGLADPVTNIVLTSIAAYANTPSYIRSLPVDHTAIEETRTFADRAHSSWVALIRFMVCYFRYLTEPQAELLLRMAGHDLRVAIEHVENYIGVFSRPEPIVPDSARTRAAFGEAAYGARCSAPDLVRLMTSRYPYDLLEPVLDDLCQGGKLTVHHVVNICKFLTCPWSPPPSRPPPPTPGFFQHSGGGVTMIVRIGDDLVSTTSISRDRVATTNLTPVPPSDEYLTDDAICMLTMFPVHHRRLISHREFRLKGLDMPEFLPFLKLQLLDIMHGFYLEAIAMLPVRALRKGHLIHAVLTAGHCYGPLDPVSNIVINSIWYDALFPLSKDVAYKVGAADILDARSMHRIESRSLDGFVAFLGSTFEMNEGEAVKLLYMSRLQPKVFNSWESALQPTVLFKTNMHDVAVAAKHPQPHAFGAFLESVSNQNLYNMYESSMVQGNQDAAFEELKGILLQKTMRLAGTVQILPHDVEKLCAFRRLSNELGQNTALEALFAKRSSFMLQQAHLRRVLEDLLVGYGHTDPLGPVYKLGVICGVARERYYSYTDCFHVNFLASSDGATESSSELFFAQFWNQADKRIEESTKSFCCPISGFHEYPGRCVVCENNSSKIVHPPSGEYHMGNTTFPFPVPGLFEADTSGKLDIDLLYVGGGEVVCK